MKPIEKPPENLDAKLRDNIADMRQSGRALWLIAELERIAREAERAE